jgi:hypothetical protein
MGIHAWTLHHDSARVHKAHSVQVFLANHGNPVVQQPPYSPEMPQYDFWLFTLLKMALKGNIFDNTDTIKEITMKLLRSAPKTHLKNLSNKGRTAGIRAQPQKETILKRIKYLYL